MKPAYTVFILMFCLPWILPAQNLVPDGDFESYVNCPWGIGQLYQTTSWIDPGNCTADYFNQCGTSGSGVPSNSFGYENARSGAGYAGFYTYNPSFPDSREYIQVKLADTLITGKNYAVSFYLSLSDNLNHATNRVGAYFSALPVSGNNCGQISVIPQVANDSTNLLTSKTGWTLVTDTFTAAGGELYMTIGNFFPDSVSSIVYVGGGNGGGSHYFIDDVSVILLNSSGTDDINNYRAIIDIFPNPCTGNFRLRSAAGLSGRMKMELYDECGRKVKEMHFLPGETLDIGELSRGIYIAKIFREQELLVVTKIVLMKE